MGNNAELLSRNLFITNLQLFERYWAFGGFLRSMSAPYFEKPPWLQYMCIMFSSEVPKKLHVSPLSNIWQRKVACAASPRACKLEKSLMGAAGFGFPENLAQFQTRPRIRLLFRPQGPAVPSAPLPEKPPNSPEPAASHQSLQIGKKQHIETLKNELTFVVDREEKADTALADTENKLLQKSRELQRIRDNFNKHQPTASLASTVTHLRTVLGQQAKDMIESTRDKDKAEAGNSFSLIASPYFNCVSLQSWHNSNAASNAVGVRRSLLMVRKGQKYLPERERGRTARICKNSCQHSWPT